MNNSHSPTHPLPEPQPLPQVTGSNCQWGVSLLPHPTSPPSMSPDGQWHGINNALQAGHPWQCPHPFSCTPTLYHSSPTGREENGAPCSCNQLCWSFSQCHLQATSHPRTTVCRLSSLLNLAAELECHLTAPEVKYEGLRCYTKGIE